jgi:peptidoglycan/LPS O-acetylase OafA/YrhL
MTLIDTRAPQRTASAPARERAIDGLRALAIAGVVCGHWLVGALSPTAADGGLAVDSPLRTFGWLAPATWVLQLLGLFFLVGGYSAANGLRRSRERGDSDGVWSRRRFRRLAWPVLAAVTLVTAALPLAATAGVPDTTVRVWAVLVVQPLWFIGIYAVVTALTPIALALDRRYGWTAALGMAGAVALVDVARYGGHLVPDWAGYLTVVPAWMFTYQLGVAWARGGVDRRVAWGLLAGGTALFVGLLVVARYPTSMVTVAGSGRSNSNPPSLLVPALAAVQAGVAILLRARLDRLLHRRPRLWAAVAALNLYAMTVFCWHQTALVAVSAAAGRLRHLPGLTDAPSAPGWLAERLAWFPVLATVLAGLALAAGRFERTTAPATRVQRVVAGAAAAAFAGYLLAVY